MSIFEDIAGLVSSKLKQFNMLLQMIRLEAKLAQLSILPLLLNVFLLLLVILSLWLTVQGFIGIGLFYYFHSIALSMFGVLIFNLMLLVLLLKYMQFNIHKMSFSKTRAYLSRKQDNNHGVQKTDHQTTKPTGKSAAANTSE